MFTFKIACMIADAFVLFVLAAISVRLGWKDAS
jgi:hypothetical protein